MSEIAEREQGIVYCGYATLLADILEEDMDQVKRHFGFPVEHRVYCLYCGDRLPRSRQSEYCSPKCRNQSRYIDVACDQCGNLFKRLESQVVYHIGKHGYQHQFCTRSCLWKWFGRRYGFGVHPEHARHSTRKWNYAVIWQLHLVTGLGALKLHVYLPSLPLGTLGYILAAMRKE